MSRIEDDELPWGLALDGNKLWICGHGKAALTQRDIATGRRICSFQSDALFDHHANVATVV